MNITEEAYIQDRLHEQIEWYNKKSKGNQRTYKYLKTIQLILSASIPFFIGLKVKQEYWTTIVAGIGVAITIIEGWLSLMKYGENWIEYRSICELLKQEKYMYLARVGVYKNLEHPFDLLVERVESIISKENINWANLNSNQKEKKNS